MSVAPNSTVKTSIKTKEDGITEHFTYDNMGRLIKSCRVELLFHHIG